MAGRPSTYSREVADTICERLARGESLRTICASEDMPPRTTVHGWVVDNVDGIADRYARAKELGLEEMADETLDIADDGRRDYSVDADGNDVVDHDHIQRAKLRVDTRKWLLSKLMPKVYGDKVQQEITGKDGESFPVMVYIPANGRDEGT
jgi:hypothetical protein